MEAVQLRQATADDYHAIARVVDAWWGRPVLGALPRMFLDLFYRSSLVIDGDDGPDAFLVGIMSPSDPDNAYIHFVGVAPHARGRGYGRLLYEQFFELARAEGGTVVSAITAPVNAESAAFHRALGFTVTAPVDDYNGPDRAMLVFRRAI